MKKQNFFTGPAIYLFVILIVTSCNLDDLETSYDQIILSNQDKVLVESANNLGFDILKISLLSKSDQNILISPLQLSSNLNLLLNGTTGSTFTLLNSYINPANISVNEINNSYKRIFESVQNLSDDNIVLLNGFWFKMNTGVNSHFSNVSEFFYKTHIDSLEFNSYSDYDKINNWVVEYSDNRLKFNSNELNSQTFSMLINAFALELNFKYPFAEKACEPFWISDSDTLMVPMLEVDASFNLYTNSYFSLLEIPYYNKSFSLMVLLPNQGVQINSVLALIDSDNWNSWIKSSVKSNIQLTMPKISLNHTIDLGQYLKNSDFNFLSSNNSDFSPITFSQDFKIDYLFSVSEFNIGNSDLGLDKGVSTNNELYATQIQINKPFLFAIKENSSNLVLHIGVIVKPNQDIR